MRNKSVTCTLILLINHLLSGTYPVNVHFSGYMSGTNSVIAWLLDFTYLSREPRAAERFILLPDNQILHIFACFLSVTYLFTGVTKPLNVDVRSCLVCRFDGMS